MPLETNADLQKLLTTAKTFQRYCEKQRDLLDTKGDIQSGRHDSLLESLPDYCTGLPVSTRPGLRSELVAVASALHRYSSHQHELLNTVELKLERTAR